jgi:AraC family transcriptional activator of pobA
MLTAERFDRSLHRRSWSFNRQPEAAHRQLVLLTDGAGEAEIDGRRLAIGAPAVAWLGELLPGGLRAEAGTTGYRGSVSEATLAAAIGDGAEASRLRHLTDQSFVLSLAGRAEDAAVLARCMEAAIGELERPQEGRAMLLSAQLRIVLVTLMRRADGLAPARPPAGAGVGLLQQFRQLVEMNFRSRWTVARYAQALGISTDRLHAICTRGTGRTPKALISERLAQEAALRLSRSSLTVEQMAYTLGFNEPAAFSNFFRRLTGVPPGRYRKSVAASRAAGAGPPPLGFDDWP